MNSCIYKCTVKPVFKGHPRVKTWSLITGGLLIQVHFIWNVLVVIEKNSLFTEMFASDRWSFKQV